MNTLGPAIKVGLTFIVAGLMGYWAFMMLAKGSCSGDPEETRLHAYFSDATLLVEKSRVQIAGLNVGYIVSRELNVKPPREELVRSKRFAKITLAVRKGMTLYSNARVAKRSASLLGEFYLEIDPGTHTWKDAQGKTHSGETLDNGDEIIFIDEAVTAPRLVEQVSEMMPIVRGLAEEIRALVQGPITEIGNSINDGLRENRAAITDILKNVDAITGDIRNVTEGADRDVRQILSDIRTVTTYVRGLVDDKDGSGVKKYGAQLKDGLSKLSSAVDRLDSTMDNMNQISAGLQKGEGTVGRLLKDEALVDDVEEMVRDAGGLIKSITGLQTYVGLRSEYNFSAGSIKTYVTLEIRPRPDKFYLIELIDDPRGRRSITSEVIRSDDPSQPLLTREDRIVTTDSLRVTFQFAKRVSFFTGRIGFKESTGGIGMDLHFWDDRIWISSDLFDFQANVFPRLKALVAWEFFRRLYIVGGVDDVFNERPRDGTGGGRDFFLGAQIRFNDQDLRQLLLFGGSALAGGAGGSN